MQFKINHSPTFSVLDLILDEGEKIFAQPKSMLCMSTGVKISAAAGAHTGKRGIFGGAKSMLTGESFFTSIFEAKRDGQLLSLAPDFFGEILNLDLQGHSYFLTKGAYLASSEKIEIKTVYEGLKGWMSKKGLFLMKASGVGELFLSSHGAIVRKTLAEGERFAVDNSYVVAFQDSVKYELVKATEDIKSSIFSGEGLINRYTGPGEIIYQTRGSQKSGQFISGLINAFT